ncbi:MAG: helix-turn-helix domain-containing protein [Dehalococcoidia bacterium]
MPGSSDRNKGPESHTHDIVLDPRVRDLLASEFPDIIDRYEELRALYGVVSQLATIRRAQGVTQAQLAERLGRPQSLISAIESGRMSPHVETLVALARELGYNIRIDLEPRTAAPRDLTTLPENGAGSMPRRGRTRKSGG